MTVATANLDSYVTGTWAGFPGQPGLFNGQRGFVQGFGVDALGGLQVIWNASITKWQLASGAVLASHVVASTDTAISRSGSGKFNLTSLGNIRIPDKSIADHSRICVRARIKHASGSATPVYAKAWLGYNNSDTSDSLIGQLKMPYNTGNRDIGWLESEALFSTETTKLFATGTLGPFVSDNHSSIGYKNAGVDRNQLMYVSIGVDDGGAGNSFELVDYLVWVA